MLALPLPFGRGGRWSFVGRSWCGFLEYGQVRERYVPKGPWSVTHAREYVTDPRLQGRTLKRVAFTQEVIAERVRQLGATLTEAYPEGDLLVLGLLKGSFIFVSDLVRQVQRPLQVDFLVVSSYGDEMFSSGHVRLVYDPQADLRGRHILLVEDIVDSGRTLSRVIEVLGTRQPASIEVCTLLDKHHATYLTHPPRFVGFDAPDEFLVGYGLDHAENFRHLPYIASLE
jgi:hypoxanthine phosphoribosyltransferase